MTIWPGSHDAGALRLPCIPNQCWNIVRLQVVADKLAQVALKRYTADNVAVVVVSFQSSGTEAGAKQAGQAGSSGGKTGKKGGLFGLFR